MVFLSGLPALILTGSSFFIPPPASLLTPDVNTNFGSPQPPDAGD
jgi:hypothetical protein